MILTNSEIMDINQNAEFDSAIGYARKIESAVLEKLKAQEPDKTKIECVTGAIYKHISGELYPREVIAAAQYIVHRYCTTPDDVVHKYEELLYAVNRKFPDETRHQTALRYIKTAESPSYTNASVNEKA